MNRYFCEGNARNPDAAPHGYVPPFNSLSFEINFSACQSLPIQTGNIYTQLESHLVNNHCTVKLVNGWSGPLAIEAQAFLDTIAPNAVLTSIWNRGFIK